jgi:hypothetical protein
VNEHAAAPVTGTSRREMVPRIFEAGCGLLRLHGRSFGGGFPSCCGGGFMVRGYSVGIQHADHWEPLPGPGISISPLTAPAFASRAGSILGHQCFCCELEPDGSLKVRHFRRGPWEQVFLTYATTVLHGPGPSGAEIVLLSRAMQRADYPPRRRRAVAGSNR